mgnify:FL=1|tara:strand:- start:3823 stop:4137 length:315 start_codon:yes stop_codon:yes gene_type:complete
MKVPNYSYLFLFLSILSFNVLAGADPDEVTLEEEMQIENATQKKDYVQKDNIELKIEKQPIAVIKDCISFPEAVAFKEHFACKADIEKNRLARLNWSFAKLLLR